MLGVTPAEPGFAVASIEPELGPLEWARGAAPSPAGLISVDVSSDAITVESPVPFQGLLEQFASWSRAFETRF